MSRKKIIVLIVIAVVLALIVATYFGAHIFIESRTITYEITDQDIAACKDSKNSIGCFGEKETKNIPCSSNEDCSLDNMKAYCSPSNPSVLMCTGTMYCCGNDGYCKETFCKK